MIEHTSASLLHRVKLEYFVVWLLNRIYSVRTAWTVIRPVEKIQWHPIVWWKVMFIPWLCHLRKLETRERLLRWGMTVEHDCVSCNQAKESTLRLSNFTTNKAFTPVLCLKSHIAHQSTSSDEFFFTQIFTQVYNLTLILSKKMGKEMKMV